VHVLCQILISQRLGLSCTSDHSAFDSSSSSRVDAINDIFPHDQSSPIHPFSHIHHLHWQCLHPFLSIYKDVFKPLHKAPSWSPCITPLDMSVCFDRSPSRVLPTHDGLVIPRKYKILNTHAPHTRCWFSGVWPLPVTEIWLLLSYQQE
jgi:hypothetical protein